MPMVDPLFKKLVETPSVSGFEEKLQNLVAKEFKTNGVFLKQDALNNCIAKIGIGKVKVLIAAHADEVGFIVTNIDESGFISFQPVGGVEEDIALGQGVGIQTSRRVLRGIIARI